jgi:hypothetical protein
LPLRPAEMDCDILAFDIAGFVQTLTERRDNRCRFAGGPAAEEFRSPASLAAARAPRAATPPPRHREA